MKMVYNIREYNTMYTGNKGSEENAIVAIIMKLLNDNKFDSIDDALKYNGNDFNTFMKNNRRDNIPIHYGRNIKDADFKDIVENFKKMVNDKLKFDNEKIHEINFDDKEYVEYNGHVVDNTLKERNIEDELKYMQQERPDYQSLDSKENTDKMMDEVINDKKREVEFSDLDSIDRDNLNEKEQRIYDAALVDEFVSGKEKDISISDGLTKDEDNNINQIKEDGNSMTIDSSSDDINIDSTNINHLSAFDTSSLTEIEKEVYDAAKKYQDITGELIRLDLDNKLVITPFNEVKDIIVKDGVLVVNDNRLLSQEIVTDSEEKEEELEKEKVKVLEFKNPYNIYSNAA